MTKILRFLSAPWWQGVSALLAIVLTVVAIWLSYVLFDIQSQRDVSHLSIRRPSLGRIHSDPIQGTASVTVFNAGPNFADLVKVKTLVGSAGVTPVSVIISNSDLVQKVSSRGFGWILPNGRDHPMCEYVLEIRDWQVGEGIQLSATFTLAPPIEAKLSDYFEDSDLSREKRLGIEAELKARFFPEGVVFESSNIAASGQWDDISILENLPESDAESRAICPEVQLR